MKNFELEVITLTNAKNELYKRSPEVEAQIRVALTMDRKKLTEQVNQRDYRSDHYFQEECLVYLVRKFIRESNYDQTSDLTEALIARFSKHVNDIISYALDQTYVEDCFREIISEVFSLIFDFDSNGTDFAEVRFWTWLDGRIFNVLRKYIRNQKKDAVTDSYDYRSENRNGYDFNEPPGYLKDKRISPENLACIIG